MTKELISHILPAPDRGSKGLAACYVIVGLVASRGQVGYLSREQKLKGREAAEMTKGICKVIGALVFVGSAFVGILIYKNVESFWLSILGILIGCLGMSAGVGIWKGRGIFGEHDDEEEKEDDNNEA